MLNQNNNSSLTRRASYQREKIIQLLRERGKNGVTNTYFFEHVTNSLGARMSELYERGYEISTISIGRGVYKYVLKNEPKKPMPKLERAEDILMRIIRQRGGVVTASELQSILEHHQFMISRKAGSKKRNKK